MERPSVTTPATTGHGAAAAQQELDGRTEGAAMEAPSPGLVRVGFQGHESLVRRDKDMIEDPRLERRDTVESCLSDFDLRRSNTGWSIAGSTATDMTDPNSPDVAFADEGLDSEAEGYASSPRRSSLFPHPMNFQKRLPFRAPSISSETDKFRAPPYGSSRVTPAPQHRRLGQMASRKSSLNISSSPTVPTTGPSSRREPSPSSALEPWATDPWIKTEDDAVNLAGYRSRNNDELGSSALGMSRTPTQKAQEAASEDRSPQERGAEDGQVWEEETDDFSKMEDDAPTPGPAMVEAGPPTAGEVTPGSATPPDERPKSRCSEAPDSCDEGDAQPTPNPDDSMIHEVCEQILQQAFGVQLHDLALAGAASAAYESVSYCLAELSHIVLDSGLSNTGIVISESTRGKTSSGAVPIWPAGGVASSVGSGGGGGSQGHGNGGGSRKRSSGADSGDGAGDGSPGGGKRQRVSATSQPSPDMHFSCPFRKRNPVRFNVRDFQNCAVQSFPDFSQLKRHVKNFHKQTTMLPFSCPRCRRAMGSQEALNAHISVDRDQICNPHKELSSADPEDGITLGIEEALNGRKADRKIDSWESLWHHLFPEDAEVPESDFIPPTELDEVYAQFNSDYCRRQLRQRIHEGLGPTNNIDSVFAIFWSHIESVFDACRAKTGGAVGGRRRVCPQTPRRMTSRQASVRLKPGRPSLGSQDSGGSDSSISSPVATPTSTNILGSLEKPPMVESQLQMPYPPPVGGYPDAGADISGVPMVSFVRRSSSTAGQGGRPITVPPPAHVHLVFGSQGQNAAEAMGSQLGHHPRLVSMDSGVGLNSGVPDRRGADFPTVPTFDSHDGFPNQDFGLSTSDLCLRLLQQETEGIQRQLFSPTNPTLVPDVTFYDASGMEGEGFEEAGHRGNQWMNG